MARELTPAATLSAYAAALALVFTAALGVGRALGPVDTGDATTHDTTHGQDGRHTAGHDADGEVR